MERRSPKHRQNATGCFDEGVHNGLGQDHAHMTLSDPTDSPDASASCEKNRRQPVDHLAPHYPRTLADFLHRCYPQLGTSMLCSRCVVLIVIGQASDVQIDGPPNKRPKIDVSDNACGQRSSVPSWLTPSQEQSPSSQPMPSSPPQAEPCLFSVGACDGVHPLTSGLQEDDDARSISLVSASENAGMWRDLSHPARCSAFRKRCEPHGAYGMVRITAGDDTRAFAVAPIESTSIRRQRADCTHGRTAHALVASVQPTAGTQRLTAPTATGDIA